MSKEKNVMFEELGTSHTFEFRM